jgi:hypothetical protein
MISLLRPASLPAASLLALLGTLPTADPLATDYSRAIRYAVSVERSFDFETTDFSMEVDGEPQERPEGLGGGGSAERRQLAYTDQILEHTASGATRVRRTFGAVEGENELRFGDQEMVTERPSPFAEAVVLLSREDGGLHAEVEEGEADAAQAERLSLVLAVDALLPEGAVEEGQRWTVDGEDWLAALGLDLEEVYFPAPPREEGGEGREGGRGRRGGFGGGRGGANAAQLFAGLDWEVELTLAAAEEESEQGPVARITLEARGEGDPPSRPAGEGGRGGGASETSGAVTVELEGELLFSRRDRLPVRVQVTGTVASESTSIRRAQDREIVTHLEQSGTFALTVTVQLEASGE